MVERAAGAEAAAPALNACIDTELEKADLSSDRLLLVGFSQETMMAPHLALRPPARVSANIGLSGMLVAPECLRSEIQSRPPVLLIHTTVDDVVPFRSIKLASNTLTEADVFVETHVSPGSVTVGADGLAAATAFACRVLS